MNDPLNDPNFPDRPQHPDFWRLSQTALQLDGAVSEGGRDAEDVNNDVVDHQSLMYLSACRMGIMLDELVASSRVLDLHALLATAYAGGLVHGISFEKAGGHRE